VIVTASLLLPTPKVFADTVDVTKFPVPGGQTISITSGSDGALWFTQENPRTIGRITTSGGITQHPLPTDTPSAALGEITAGADGEISARQRRLRTVHRGPDRVLVVPDPLREQALEEQRNRKSR